MTTPHSDNTLDGTPEAREFDKFTDLARKLVKVPKHELDEARERERLAKG